MKNIQKIIKEIQRKSKIITYLTRDGEGPSAKISMDIIPVFLRNWIKIKKCKEIEKQDCYNKK